MTFQLIPGCQIPKPMTFPCHLFKNYSQFKNYSHFSEVATHNPRLQWRHRPSQRAHESFTTLPGKKDLNLIFLTCNFQAAHKATYGNSLFH